MEIQEAKNVELSAIKSSFKCQLKANRFTSKVEMYANNMLKYKKDADSVKMKRKAFELFDKNSKTFAAMREKFKAKFTKPKNSIEPITITDESLS